MDYLDGMQKAPFDMIISDVNMPARNPTGLGLVRYIKKGYPNQKVLVYSDDYANIRHLEKEHGVLSVNKVSEKNNVDELKEHLVRELKLAPIKKPKGKAKFTPTRIRGP